MQKPPYPINETQRLAELESYSVLDTAPEAGFDDLTAIAAEVCGTPIALVSLIDLQRQWFKSHHGLAATETPREVAFCAHTILQTDPLVVHDSLIDPRFHDNPLATGAPHVRFYAGAPLINPNGFALGTLCVIDHQPRQLSDTQMDVLLRLGRQVIAQLELRRSRDQAKHLMQAKSQFLANMSHEIRTPLNGVLGMAQLLSDTALNDEQRQLLKSVQHSGEHLLGVVNEILDYSKLEAGRVTVERSPLDLKQLLSDTLNLLSANARPKGLQLELKWHSTRSPKRLGDAHQIRQIVMNFVSNAIKFTQQGGVTVEVHDHGQTEVQIIVCDTGIGIAPEVLPTLFQRFTQADGSTTRKYGGTGLGLAIAEQLATLMSGRVGADSTPGKGSRFWCTLPLECAPDSVVSPQSAPATSVCNLSGVKILVVEDDATNLLLITRILTKYHQGNATTAGNGAQAVELCSHEAFDLILMDGMMPLLDGYQATQHIRALPHPWAKTVPIIGLTASALEGDRERCLLAGMSDYLTKPIDRQALNEALLRATAPRTSSTLSTTAIHHAAG